MAVANEASTEDETEVEPQPDEPSADTTAGAETQVLCCLREGCTNPPVDDPKWENEYCSSYCVIVHCKSIFQNWVTAKKSDTATTANDTVE